jgi:dihydrofolate reductase
MDRTGGDFAERMNSLPKFVASTSLEEPLEWQNSSLLKGDVAENVRRLKDQPGQDILMYSSATLMHALMEHGLIDDFRVWVHPLVLGSGGRLFQEGVERTELKLVDTKTLPNGVAILSYERAGN